MYVYVLYTCITVLSGAACQKRAARSTLRAYECVACVVCACGQPRHASNSPNVR